MNKTKVTVIGAGLAGSESAWQLANRGVQVVLYDMKPHKMSPAHKSSQFGELVCSNSLRSDDYEHNAVGLLHEELRLCNSLIMEAAMFAKVPAGGALAVDRDEFAGYITNKLLTHPNIKVIAKEVNQLPKEDQGLTVIATGPLTTEKLAQEINARLNFSSLSFYDAIAPVIYKDSIDFSKAWYQSRYDKGEGLDYINCPLTKEEYENFVDALLKASKVEFHPFETPEYFDGCLPIEIMAERGRETLAFGPMKPVGLTNPHANSKPYAVVQLRQDNKEDTLRNMVGFQTKLKYSEQERIFRMIPGLENARFARFGGIHKNIFIKSPEVLDNFLRMKLLPHIMFAGQITGCEGYVESAAIGLLSGYFAACFVLGVSPELPPRTTALGSMLAHLSDETTIETYQPMNINFGLFPEISWQKTSTGKLLKLKGQERKEKYCQRALADIRPWLTNFNNGFERQT